MMWTVLALSTKECRRLDIAGIVAVGGSACSGEAVAGLKHRDEYAVLSPAENGVTLHSFKGKKRDTLLLKAYEHAVIGDLTLVALPRANALIEAGRDEGHRKFIDDFNYLLQSFARPGDFHNALSLLFESLVAQFEMEKGLVITKNAHQEFSLVLEKNITRRESWLSETLVTETLGGSAPIFIQNIVGSHFESSQSLMATGFISVAAWPLAVRGEILGALILGSEKPHAGLSETQRKQAGAYVQLAALMLKFHLNDLKLKEEIDTLRKLHRDDRCPLLTENPELEKTIQLAVQIADANLSVLIQGETGTGKELLARWIHEKSARRARPFVAVNCSAIPAELLESLLFGHRKGAFTGAVRDQRGKFELAHGGTLFLDEVGDLPLALQAKLLRVLQERMVEPLGSESEVRIDVRVIVATHKSLPQAIAAGQFREDLFYRVAEMTLEIPPLRDRLEDLHLISMATLKELGADKRFSPEAWQWLKNQEWTGNVRELISAVRRASALAAGDEIRREHLELGAPRRSSEKPWLGGGTLEEAKSLFLRSKIQKALEISGDNRTQAASLLGITPRTLFRYLEEERESEDSL